MVIENPDLEFVGGVDIRDVTVLGKPVVPIRRSLAAFIDEVKPDVMIDFTVAAATMINAKIAAKKRRGFSDRHDRFHAGTGCRAA